MGHRSARSTPVAATIPVMPVADQEGVIGGVLAVVQADFLHVPCSSSLASATSDERDFIREARLFHVGLKIAQHSACGADSEAYREASENPKAEAAPWKCRCAASDRPPTDHWDFRTPMVSDPVAHLKPIKWNAALCKCLGGNNAANAGANEHLGKGGGNVSEMAPVVIVDCPEPMQSRKRQQWCRRSPSSNTANKNQREASRGSLGRRGDDRKPRLCIEGQI